MAKANQPQRNTMREQSQIENLPRDLADDELESGTIAGQNLGGTDQAMAGEDIGASATRTTATTKTRAAQDRQPAAAPTTMRNKKDNQPSPPKR